MGAAGWPVAGHPWRALSATMPCFLPLHVEEAISTSKLYTRGKYYSSYYLLPLLFHRANNNLGEYICHRATS